MLQAGEIKPEAKGYYEKIVELWERAGDKEAAANWLSVLGETEKAKVLYREEAEECLSVDEKFNMYKAVSLFKKAGDEKRANELISKLIKDDLARGDKYDAAALHKQYGDKEEARRLFLENGRELEQKMMASSSDESEKRAMKYWARQAYEAAGAEDDVRRMVEADIKDVVEITGDPDSAFIAFDAERVGDVERAKRAYRKLAELYEKHMEGADAETSSLMISMPAVFYTKAGETEKAKETYRRAAEFAEKKEKNIGQAVALYAKLSDATEVKRLLEESIVKTQSENDKRGRAKALTDLWFLDKSQEHHLAEAKRLYLEYAKEMEASQDPTVIVKAISAYREAADIVNGTVQPTLAFYWGKLL